MTPGPQAYLDAALDYIERRALHRDQVSWTALRADALTAAADARTPADTHDAIEAALRRLGDRHSFLKRPARAADEARGVGADFGLLVAFPEGVVSLIWPDGPAARAGVRERDTIAALDGQP